MNALVRTQKDAQLYINYEPVRLSGSAGCYDNVTRSSNSPTFSWIALESNKIKAILGRYSN